MNSYWDYKVNYYLPNGSIGELIILTDWMNYIKMGIGHELYNITRSIERTLEMEKAGELGKTISEEQITALDDIKEALSDISDTLYSDSNFSFDNISNALEAVTLQVERGESLLRGLTINLDEELSTDSMTKLKDSLSKADKNRPSSASENLKDLNLSKSESSISSSSSDYTTEQADSKGFNGANIEESEQETANAQSEASQTTVDQTNVETADVQTEQTATETVAVPAENTESVPNKKTLEELVKELKQADTKEAKDAIGNQIVDMANEAKKARQENVEKRITKDAAKKLKDITGGTFIMDSFDSIKNAVEAIEKEGLLKIDRIKAPKSMNSYWDYKVNYYLPNGSIGELIILTDWMNYIKMGIGHELYNITRSIERTLEMEKAGELGKTISTEQKNALIGIQKELSNLSNTLYSDINFSFDNTSKALDAVITEVERGESLFRGLTTNLDEELSAESMTKLRDSLSQADKNRPSSASESLKKSNLSKSESSISSSSSDYTTELADSFLVRIPLISYI